MAEEEQAYSMFYQYLSDAVGRLMACSAAWGPFLLAPSLMMRMNESRVSNLHIMGIDMED